MRQKQDKKVRYEVVVDGNPEMILVLYDTDSQEDAESWKNINLDYRYNTAYIRKV